MLESSSTGSISMLPYRIEVFGGAGWMLFSQTGLVKSRRRGAVVIIAPLSSTALESSGEVWTSWTMVWARAYLSVGCGLGSSSSDEDVSGSGWWRWGVGGGGMADGGEGFGGPYCGSVIH